MKIHPLGLLMEFCLLMNFGVSTYSYEKQDTFIFKKPDYCAPF